jgi:hypothetical protein
VLLFVLILTDDILPAELIALKLRLDFVLFNNSAFDYTFDGFKTAALNIFFENTNLGRSLGGLTLKTLRYSPLIFVSCHSGFKITLSF